MSSFASFARTARAARAARKWPVLALLGAASTWFGCEKDAIVGTPLPNFRPDTDVSGAPPDVEDASFSVGFAWNGWDQDGEIAGYEWRISNNGVDGIVDVVDTLQALLPWHWTTATDSVFLVTADLDSFPPDVSDPAQTDERSFRYWQTHTFFVRSVDDRGGRDRSPATVSFTATTIAPQINIHSPPRRSGITCESASRVMRFGWNASDPDGEQGRPTHVRYTLIPLGSGIDDCIIQSEFERGGFIRDDDPGWSGWLPYDPQRGLNTEVVLPRQESRGAFLFAAQARDAAGAVTPTFEWNRNVRHVQVSDSKFPLLSVTERFLGLRQFVGLGGFQAQEIVSLQPLAFSWQGDASPYGGEIEAYRYGWNVLDPDDPLDPGWAVEWGNGTNWRRATPRVFSQGTPVFVVQCRDDSGAISRAVYSLPVIQITERANQRNLLFVNDWADDDTENEAEFRLYRDDLWEQILGGAILGFQRGDRIEASEDRLRFRTVSEYKSVIWFNNGSSRTFMHSRFAPREGIEQYNWLQVYQARVGNILVVGPSAMFNSIERATWRFPVIFPASEGGNFGFGVGTRPDGTSYLIGTTRWPYQAWCVESIDRVRPPAGLVFGEIPGLRLRSQDCDAMVRAIATEEFTARYPDAASEVRDLRPTRDRVELDRFNYTIEEFYNSNRTSRSFRVIPRDCQVPMFELGARWDEGYVEDPGNCPPGSGSSLQGAVVGLASTVYSDTKQLRGSEDFVWGFNVLAFDPVDVRDALYWILSSRWELPVQR